MATQVEVHVNVHIHDGVGLIQLNRPEKMNAIGALTRKQLGEAIKQVERDDAVPGVVLTGAGRAFCSGADVTEVGRAGGLRAREALEPRPANQRRPVLTGPRARGATWRAPNVPSLTRSNRATRKRWNSSLTCRKRRPRARSSPRASRPSSPNAPRSDRPPGSSNSRHRPHANGALRRPAQGCASR